MKKTLDDNPTITASKIYNVDESGLSTVQRPRKVAAMRGSRNTRVLTSAERGSHSTVVCCMNAAGNFIPPALLFPRKTKKSELYDAAPPDTLALWDESGWMTSDCFFKWMKHFRDFVRCTKDDPVLLLLDSHASHLNIQVLEFAKTNGIIMISFPPHCTDRLQPLDVSFYFPLKSLYNDNIAKWVRTHGRKHRLEQVAENFAQAYNKLGKGEMAINGFRCTGIWPFDQNVFPEHEYYVEDLETNSNPLSEVQKGPGSNLQLEGSSKVLPSPEPNLPVNENVIASSPLLESNLSVDENAVILPVDQPKKVSPADLGPSTKLETPAAKLTKAGVPRKSRRQKSAVLTSSPYLIEARKKAEEKAKKTITGKVRGRPKKATRTQKAAEIARRLDFGGNDQPHASFSEILAPSKAHITSAPSTTSAHTLAPPSGRAQSSVPASHPTPKTDENVSCIHCSTLYVNSLAREKWIQCLECLCWAHIKCTPVGKYDPAFICGLCQ